ncbi:MAG: hypothetical protein J6C31_06245 [Prevotella sp.]|nr:hypothetical protein [Prevotella sp.]
MEKICIYIDGYIFATVKPNRFLLYNFEERTGRTFPVYNELTYKTLLSLTNPSNSYSIIIDKNLLKLKDLQDIVSFLKQNYWGDCITITGNDKPITFIPLCNLEGYKQKELNSIIEITIAINNEKERLDLPTIQKQIPYIYQASSYKEIDLDLLKEFIFQLSSDVIINITGGNIFEYSRFRELHESISCFNNINFFFRKEYINKKLDINNSSIIFTSLTPHDEILCKEYDIPNVSFYFIVENNEELNTALSIKQKLKNANIIIQPYWKNNNIFFEEFVLFEKNDLLLQNKSKSDIYINKNINKNFYGNIFIDPYGYIYTSYNLPQIGNYKDSIKQILENATKPDQAWHLTRATGICADCIYQWFCPAISDYELFLNKLKPCKIK